MSSLRKISVILLLVLNSGLGYSSLAQYKPMLTQTKEWLIKTCELGGCLHDYYYFQKDTIIHGTSYKVLDGYHYNQNFFLREDVAQQQVFIQVPGGPVVTEYLLYDFGMQIGDSIYLTNPVSPALSVKGFYTLDSIVSKSFEQDVRRVFYLSGKDVQGMPLNTIWIEGVGSAGLINTPGVVGDTAKMAELLCVTEDKIKIYSRKQNDTCYSNPELNMLEREVARPELFFDYTSSELRFNEIKGGEAVFVYDLSGELVLQKVLEPGVSSLAISLSEGIYIVRVKSGDYSVSQKVWVKN